ncbi:MAG: hypothetical protein KF884_10150 [Fimbriimonadaceae bacterium]|nr:hypothetical protein [Fimbriimonadaceae bacterium]QYK57908.1 MAG: hypothetical protein KF884_10150 [Fimbriimonadaceae bacterium]
MAKVVTAGWMPGLSGSMGNAVFVSTRDGTVVRERPRGRRSFTPAACEARERVRQIGLFWKNMSVAEAEAWRVYARGLEPQEPAQQLFTRLAVRAMVAGYPIPASPPEGPFLGDSPKFSLSTLPGRVVVTASGANSAGVVTVVALQRLVSAHRRTYLSRYRSAVVLSLPGPGPVELGVLAGVWAVAARFILGPTGQSTAFAELGRVIVE